MAHDVFISYSHKDKPIADAICSNLENAGVRCWIAPRDITPGVDWPTAISNAIGASRMMVLVFSAHSNSSNDVSRELILAANNNLIVIPFKIDQITPEPGKQYYLARTHWLDAMNPPTQEQIDTLVRYVKSFMTVQEPLATAQSAVETRPAPAQQTREPGPSRNKKGVPRKSLWIWGTLLILALIGGSAGMVRYFGQKATPNSPATLPTPTVNTTETQPGLTANPSTTPAPVTITIWHQWSNDQLPVVQDVFDEYMVDHPNVTIVLANLGANATTSLKAAIPSGQGPDIVAGSIAEAIGENAQAGNIVPLDDYGITQDWLKSIYEPVPASGVIWDDKIWGLPESQMGIAIIYNKALASATDFPNNPIDLNTLISSAEDFYRAKGIPLFCYGNINGFFLAPVIFGFGVPTFLDPQGQAYLDTPQALEAMTWLNNSKPYTLWEAGPYRGTSAMLEGKAAAVWNGLWMIPDIEKAGIDYGILPMGRPFVFTNALLLTSNAVDRDHDEIAVDIMKYYTSAEVQKKAVLANTGNIIFIPAQTAVLNDPQIQANPIILGFREALRQGVPAMNHPYKEIAWEWVNGAVSAIWDGSQTPEEALAAAQAGIEAGIAGMK